MNSRANLGITHNRLSGTHYAQFNRELEQQKMAMYVATVLGLLTKSDLHVLWVYTAARLMPSMIGNCLADWLESASLNL